MGSTGPSREPSVRAPLRWATRDAEMTSMEAERLMLGGVRRGLALRQTLHPTRERSCVDI